MQLPDPAGHRSILRLIDANLNRAAEGLRTCEDLARFLLDDQSLAQEAKHLRHAAVTAILTALGDDRLSLITARDSEHDIGPRSIKPQSQTPKVALTQIAPAAAQRAQQALRVLEETTGLLGPQGAAQVPTLESLRYRLYTLDQNLSQKIAALQTPNWPSQFQRGIQWKLCVLITESLCKRPWQEVARAAMQAGADCIQLREKDLTDHELLARARWLVEESHLHTPAHAHPPAHAHRGSPHIVINDRVDIALLSGAHGVHLGQDDLSPHDAKALCKRFGRELLIGLSTHDAAELAAALTQPIDYVGLGAMFSTTTKPRATAGPQYLADALRTLANHHTQHATPIGHLAIGGLTADRAAHLADLGCQGVAVSSTICAADDPFAATQAFLMR